MKISVKVKPRSGRTRVERVTDREYKVWVTAAPDKGKANEAVIEALSEHLDVPKSRIIIVSGQTMSSKVIEIG